MCLVRACFAAALTTAAALVSIGCQPSWPTGLSLGEPVQGPLPEGTPQHFEVHGARFEPKAAYEIEAVVLSTMR